MVREPAAPAPKRPRTDGEHLPCPQRHSAGAASADSDDDLSDVGIQIRYKQAYAHTHTYYRSLSLTHSLTHTQTWMRSKQWQSHDQPRTSGPANTRLSFLRGAELPSCGRIRTRLMTTVALFCSRCMYIYIHLYIHISSMCVRARLCARACKHVAFVPASTSLGFRDQCLVFRVLGIRS